MFQIGVLLLGLRLVGQLFSKFTHLLLVFASQIIHHLTLFDELTSELILNLAISLELLSKLVQDLAKISTTQTE